MSSATFRCVFALCLLPHLHLLPRGYHFCMHRKLECHWYIYRQRCSLDVFDVRQECTVCCKGVWYCKEWERSTPNGQLHKLLLLSCTYLFTSVSLVTSFSNHAFRLRSSANSHLRLWILLCFWDNFIASRRSLILIVPTPRSWLLGGSRPAKRPATQRPDYSTNHQTNQITKWLISWYRGTSTVLYVRNRHPGYHKWAS